MESTISLTEFFKQMSHATSLWRKNSSITAMHLRTPSLVWKKPTAQFPWDECHKNVRNNQDVILYRPSDRVREKNEELRGNFWQYYAEVSDDYAEISKLLIKLFPWLFQMNKKLITCYWEINSFMTCLTCCCHSWKAISSFNAVFQ